jgi:hypothetical protein
MGPDVYGASMVVLTDEEYAGVVNRAKSIFLYTKVVYEDIFNVGLARESEFCFKIACSGTEMKPNGKLGPRWDITQTGPQNSAT